MPKYSTELNRDDFMELKEKIAIITGAGAGIGEATAYLLAKEGAFVCCNSLSQSAEIVADKINNTGGTAIFIQGDVSQEDQVKKIIDRVILKFGKIDILFNNAGIVPAGAIHEISTEEWDNCMAINLKSIYLMTKYSYPYLKKTQGTIVNNSSSVAFKGVSNRAAYTASKGAVLSLTRAMATDYLKDNIRVNAICPGTTDTPSLAIRLSKFDDPEKARKDFIARQPLKRLGTSIEIAQGVIFLIKNEFCTGVCQLIDGGMTM